MIWQSKIRLIFLFVILLCNSYLLLADTVNKQDLKDTSALFLQPDSVKIDSLISLGRELRFKHPEKAKEIFNECYKISLRNGLQGRLVNSVIQYGTIFLMHSDFDSAHYYFDKSIHLADSLKLNYFLAKVYRIKAIAFTKTGLQDSAMNYLRKSIIVLNGADSVLLSIIYNTMGNVVSREGAYDSAYYYYYKSFKLLGNNPEKYDGYSQLINIADVLTEMEEFDKAKSFIYDALNLLSDLHNNAALLNKGLAYIKLATVYYFEKDYDSALYYFRRCGYYYNKVGQYSHLTNLYLNIGTVYSDLENYDSALYYYNLSKECWRGDEKEYIPGVLYNNIAFIYMRSKKYDLALKYLDTAIYNSTKNGNLTKLTTYYANIHQIYNSKHNYKKAYEWVLKYNSLHDSLYNIEKAKIINDLELKYEKEKDQAHILSLQNENLQKSIELNRRTNQRNIFLGGGSAILIIGIMLFAFYRQRVKKDRIIAGQMIEKLEREKKLLAAKAIVEGQEEERKRIAGELHDGLGVLLSTAKMQFKTLEDKSPENREAILKAANLLEKASSDVRRISHNMMPGILTKLGLDEALEDLFENINNTPGIAAELKIENEDDIRLPENSEIMIYRIIQEMANNTLKYAEAGKVTLDVTYEEETVSIHYSDNGKGFDLEEKMKNKSIGLTSIQSRVNFLGGKININSKPGRGTTYFINIPIIYNS